MPATDKIAKLLQKMNGFDTILRPVKVISASKGSIEAEVKLTKDHMNTMGGLHGGFSATLVDVISGMGLLTHDSGCRYSVSVNMNLSYLSGAKEGDTIEIKSRTLKAGKTLAFLQIEIKNKETGVLLVKGSHTKFLLDK